MSRYEAYCNTTTDLTMILPEIDNFDRKRLIQNFVVHSGSVYVSHDAGHISQLYIDGLECTLTSSLSDVDTNNEYFYNSATDALYVKSATNPNDLVVEASEDWETIKSRVTKEKADFIRSFLNRPIYKIKNSNLQGANAREYDYVIIYCNAALAVAELVRTLDVERANEIELRIMNENNEGLLDRIKRGEFQLFNESSERFQNGVIHFITYNGSSTGSILDTKGFPKVSWDDVRLVITTGGTLSPGSASTIKYSVYTKDDSGLRRNLAVENEILTGAYDPLAYGVYFRASEGVYTTNDEFSIVLSGMAEDNASVKSRQAYR
jgi:hypothetical protein